ncbi:MAG: hypothetical protein Q7S50_00820 [bacterium]|nr:hypothetical protein [bacterium]
MHALSLHRFLLRAALAIASIFAWIFVFQYFYLVEHDIVHAFARTLLLYALSQTITCLVTPYAARSLRKGVRRMLLIATFFLASAFVILGGALVGFWGSTYASSGIVAFAFLLGIYRALYWIPYAVEARAVSRTRATVWGEILIALLPAVAGLLIAGTASGPLLVLFIGAGAVALSAIPILYFRNVHERFSWRFRETFTELSEQRNRALVVVGLLEGMSGAALLLFWPLTMFLMMGWSYSMLGITLSLTFLVAVFGRSFVRKRLRSVRLHDSALLNTLFSVTPWLFRLTVGTPLQAVLVDSYFYTTVPRRSGIDPFTFEQSADGGSYVDEYTALKEMALALGRIAMCFLGAGIALMVSLPVAFIVVFIIAAIASAMATLELS